MTNREFLEETLKRSREVPVDVFLDADGRYQARVGRDVFSSDVDPLESEAAAVASVVLTALALL